ncbi:DeoR/GlpR family DNA-binding transcription regulator [Acrocarpospora catenulata]|uniref:DeoR/GlpR family DNA-binding transcription regulator n=1 Tax=Acrocarpospora catenulata TaxID=2836182 RepID=UPI001BDB5E48|nr:DeoR/GlpR family DNA-binding transcription regulator [Acrocarpospora catenulata]
MSNTSEPVPAEVRRERILAMVLEHEFVRVSDLSTMFGISDVTVRADLGALEERNALRRVRGGAMAVGRRPREEPSFEEALSASAIEKTLIGAAAAAMISDGESVMLDVGTTTTFIARALVARDDLRDVVVFTNGLNIALELEVAIPRITVVLTGGTLRPLQHSLVDPMAQHVFERVNTCTVFLGCNGVHPVAGITNINLPEAEMKKRMLRATARRVVVADGSKIGQIQLAAVAPISGVDLLITGPSADARTLDLLRDQGLRVEVVGS